MRNFYVTMSDLISGIVIGGSRIGRSIECPTANLNIDNGATLPRCGVYAARVKLRGTEYGAMLYIGKRPTVGTSEQVVVEVNILDFEGNIYGERLEVEIIDFVREESQFNSLEALQSQLVADRKIIENILRKTE